MRPDLAIVQSTLPDPPYCATTSVNGWRFELDYQRLEQSDTWALAGPEWRPWLLMLWLQAWRQIPAGSMPDDDTVIAAKIGMDPRIFGAHKDILMRGFRLHSDGRLYHAVIVSLVSGYMTWKESERTRKAEYRERKLREDPQGEREKMREQKAAYRARQSQDVPRLSHVCPMGKPTQEQEQEQEQVINTHASHESPVAGANGTPYAAIRDLWIEILPTLTRPIAVEHWTDARKAQLRNRWKDQLPTLDAWRKCFERIAKSPFLMGRASGRDGRPFKCDLFWVTKPENLLKLYEGRYDDNQSRRHDHAGH